MLQSPLRPELLTNSSNAVIYYKYPVLQKVLLIGASMYQIGLQQYCIYCFSTCFQAFKKIFCNFSVDGDFGWYSENDSAGFYPTGRMDSSTVPFYLQKHQTFEYSTTAMEKFQEVLILSWLVE